MALRILASDASIDAHRLRLGLYTEAEEQRIIDSIGNLSDLPVYIDDTPFQGMVEMRSKARRLSLEHGLDLLVVDYLQLIQGPGRGRGGENRVQEISEISRSIKGMARDLHVPIITCSQLSRLVEGRPGHRPVLSDLRDSGSIEQDADIVMFIYREDVYYTEEEWEQHFPGRPYPRGIAEIILAKHRHGPTGSVRLHFPRQPGALRVPGPRPRVLVMAPAKRPEIPPTPLSKGGPAIPPASAGAGSFRGFPRGVQFTPVPDPLFGPLLEEIDDLAELKVTLRAVWLCHQQSAARPGCYPGKSSATTWRCAGGCRWAKGRRSQEIQRGLDRAVARGSLLRFTGICLRPFRKEKQFYLLNTDTERQARSPASPGSWPFPMPDNRLERQDEGVFEPSRRRQGPTSSSSTSRTSAPPSGR